MNRELTYWKIDECAAYFDRLKIVGWCHVPGATIARVEVVFEESGVTLPLASFGQPSPDVDRAYGPGASHVRFDEWLTASDGVFGRPFSVRCWLENGECVVGRDALTNAAWGDPYFQSWEDFLSLLHEAPSGAVLELGSRARSAVTRRHRIPSRFEYVGFDIHAGPNVDVIGDVHELSAVFPERRFVMVFSASVFEHLGMPWKVALEINRVLAPGGLVYSSTHQTYPMHDEPWDFWRFSQHSWAMLFNRATGFELVQAAVGEPARIHPCRTSPLTRDMPLNRGWLGSAAIARKIGDSALSWPVTMTDIVTTRYPVGDLAVAPTTDAA